MSLRLRFLTSNKSTPRRLEQADCNPEVCEQMINGPFFIFWVLPLNLDFPDLVRVFEIRFQNLNGND